jgi:hypothetical protein
MTSLHTAFFSISLLSLAAFCTACGDSGGDGGDGGSTGQGGGGSSTGLCQQEKTGLSGSIDGESIELSLDKSGHSLNQLSDPATYTITFDGGNISFAWTGGPISSGQSTPVTGTVRVNGTTYCFATGSLRLGDDGGFDEFDVSQLSESADNGVTCPGTNVSGQLEGCSDSD